MISKIRLASGIALVIVSLFFVTLFAGFTSAVSGCEIYGSCKPVGQIIVLMNGSNYTAPVGPIGPAGPAGSSFSLWNETLGLSGIVTLHPNNLTPHVGIGTNTSAYDLEVRNTNNGSDGNTAVGISSGAGNRNASLFFRETDAVRYQLYYNGFTSLFQIYSFAIDKAVLSFTSAGNAEFSQNLNVIGNITTPNANITDTIYASEIKLNLDIIITCNAPTEGSIYYNSTTKKHYGCNSTDWNALY